MPASILSVDTAQFQELFDAQVQVLKEGQCLVFASHAVHSAGGFCTEYHRLRGLIPTPAQRQVKRWRRLVQNMERMRFASPPPLSGESTDDSFGLLSNISEEMMGGIDAPNDSSDLCRVRSRRSSPFNLSIPLPSISTFFVSFAFSTRAMWHASGKPGGV